MTQFSRWIAALAVAAPLSVSGTMPAAAQGITVAKATLSADACQRFMAAALAEAAKNKLTVAIAIVDDGGNLIAFQRMDGAAIGMAVVAQGKARTAAQFKMPTRAIGEMVNRIGINMITTPDMISLGGGVPVVVDGTIVGAVGASGGTGDQDLQILQAGLKALGL